MSKLPPWLRAAVTTSVQTFLAAFLVTLLGLIGDVQDWIGGGEPPDLTAPAKAVASAVVALVAGVITAVYRAVKPPAISYPASELLAEQQAQQQRDAANRLGRIAGPDDR